MKEKYFYPSITKLKPITAKLAKKKFQTSLTTSTKSIATPSSRLFPKLSRTSSEQTSPGSWSSTSSVDKGSICSLGLFETPPSLCRPPEAQGGEGHKKGSVDRINSRYLYYTL